jgi:hypothetical protein
VAEVGEKCNEGKGVESGEARKDGVDSVLIAPANYFLSAVIGFGNKSSTAWQTYHRLERRNNGSVLYENLPQLTGPLATV